MGPLCSPVSFPTLIKVLFWVLWIDATALWGNWEVLGEFWGETQTRCLVSIWSLSQWTACVQIVNMPFIWRFIVALKVFLFFCKQWLFQMLLTFLFFFVLGELLFVLHTLKQLHQLWHACCHAGFWWQPHPETQYNPQSLIVSFSPSV